MAPDARKAASQLPGETIVSGSYQAIKDLKDGSRVKGQPEPRRNAGGAAK